MVEYIERGALKEYLYGGKFQEGCTGCDEPGEGCIECIVDEIDNFPAADVAPVVHGRWICINKRYGEYECSVCHGVDANCSDYYGIHAVTEQEFCPNCGAKMDKEETNELDKRKG